jgi:hypothetical protein
MGRRDPTPLVDCWKLNRGLRQAYLLGLEPLGPLFHYEGNARAFIQSAITTGLDGRKVNKHVLATVALDESKSFSSIKPFHCTGLFHILISSLSIL